MLLNLRWGVNAELTVTGLDLWYKTVHLDFLADLDAHQVFSNLERSRIGLSSMRNHIGNVGRHNVRVDRELWFYASEDDPRLLRCRMVLDYFLLLFQGVCAVRLTEGRRINYLVNQNVGSLSELNQVFRRT